MKVCGKRGGGERKKKKKGEKKKKEKVSSSTSPPPNNLHSKPASLRLELIYERKKREKRRTTAAAPPLLFDPRTSYHLSGTRYERGRKKTTSFISATPQLSYLCASEGFTLGGERGGEKKKRHPHFFPYTFVAGGGEADLS